MTNTNTHTTDLPAGWVEVELGTLFEFEYGKGLTKKQRNADGEFPVYGSNGIVGYHDEFLIEGPVLIVGRKGAAGEVAISKVACWPIDTTYFVKVPEYLSLEFSYYLLKSLRLDQFDRSTAIPGLNRNDAYRVRILLPPLAEQHRIVAKIEELFSDLDHSIAALKQAREQLTLYRQAVLKHAFEGKLTEQWRKEQSQSQRDLTGFQNLSGLALLDHIKTERQARTQQQLAAWQTAVEAWESQGKRGRKPAKPKKPKDLPPLTEAELAKLPSLPEGWVWVKLERILIELKNGYFGGRPSDDPVGTPILRINAVRPMNVSFDERRYLPDVDEDKLEEYSLQTGDLLFTRYNGSRDLAGACGLVRTREYPLLYPDKLIRVRVEKQVLSNFLEAYFVSLQGRYFIEEKLKTTAGQYGISGADLRQIFIPLPSLSEQHAIVEEIEARLSVVDKLAETIDTALQQAGALRQSILKQAFAGKLVPQDPNDEAAGVLLERIRAGSRN